MEQYISKDAIVAEIKTRIETYNKGYANGDDCRADALETFLHDIDFFEVKEVDSNEAFIEKAVKFLKEWNAYRVCLEGHKDWFIEQFKKYMEE